ncbi:phosphoribosylanthranilate isomerase [Pedobacter frigiditerrae]|uniref:N-(5'-phosphoribosyl)anthranilate isomerase n=1 Tax=Pedobacter frigiditerrae TaxID=2530452 RepID=A0A4R0MX97_9SPHI|nr:phosphoribosylanthranilate isomerase [Pedobacter frigiditerrae]TCC91901.1 phosphoribosylanthranilate isomerase [Pedobacter frigiditerrae]
MKLKLKVCGMRQASNIAAVAELQPDYLGFIFYQKSPRFISGVSAELIKYVPSTIKTTGVFVNEDLERVKAYIFKYNLKAVQLHGQEDVVYCEALKPTGVEIIKAFGIDENFDFSKLEAYLNVVDYFLFDTQTPDHGGSGKIFDWKLLTNYTFNKPYFLSGGIDLTHTTTIKNINDPRLYAVDVNSKFELEPGLKDVEKLREFFKEMNS